MKSEAKLEQKRRHDQFMEIKRKLDKGLPTTFTERNIYNMYQKRMKAKQRKS